MRFLPFVSHEKVLQLLSEADMLYLTETPEQSDFIPGKLFEYLAARRFILATIPTKGEASHLIRRFEAGVVLPSDDIEGIAQALIEVHHAFKEGKLTVKHSLEDIKEFTWDKLTVKLADLFNEVTGKRK